MKKLFYVCIAFLFMSFALPATAQHRIGIIGGLNFADANVEVQQQSADVNTRTVFGIGGVLDLSLNRIFSFRMEPMYLQKGLGDTELDIQPGIIWQAKSSCMELPMFLKAEFGNTLKPYIMAGPSIGILLSSDVEANFGGATLKGDAKEASKTFDFSAAFGAGVSYPIGKASFFIEGRYFLGLTDTVAGGTFDIAAGPIVTEIEWDEDTDKIKNRGIQFMAGFTLPLGN